MAQPILVIGDSGAGKTSSLKFLNPSNTYIADCDQKGLPWIGWRNDYGKEKGNYLRSSRISTIKKLLKNVNDDSRLSYIKTVVIDTLNGCMIDDEFERAKERTFDKWMDLAASIYDLVSSANNLRSDLTAIFIAHAETIRTDDGYVFTRMKTSGQKLNKIVIESKFNIVIRANNLAGQYVFEVMNNGTSTVKVPQGIFNTSTIPNNMQIVVDALKDF